jgi:DNA polymerase (family 10)
VLELQGADRFRVRAYDNAATAISLYPQELKELFKQHYDLDKIPGVGKTLVEKLTELFSTGTIEAFQKYVSDIPAGTWPLAQLHGIGVKKAYKLATTFKLDDEATALAQIKQHAHNHDIRLLAGFGEKSESELITMIDNHKQHSRIPYSTAHSIAQSFVDELKKCDAVVTAEMLGSLRRHSPTIGDIDLGIATTDIGRVEECVKNMKSVKRLVVSGPQLLRVMLTSDFQVDIKVSTKAEWGAFLQHFTGSKEHNIKLREYALDKGMSLSEHGIKDTKTSQLTTFDDETEFYRYLGLNWIKPEERVGGSEIELARLT